VLGQFLEEASEGAQEPFFGTSDHVGVIDGSLVSAPKRRVDGNDGAGLKADGSALNLDLCTVVEAGSVSGHHDSGVESSGILEDRS